MPNKAEQVVAKKILHILDHFPKISPSMLQISLGSGMPTAVWHPVLEQLIKEELVYKTQILSESPSGRCETKTIISNAPINIDVSTL